MVGEKTCKCVTCGFVWLTGTDGSHDCATMLIMKINKINTAFKEIRSKWFEKHIMSKAQERVWESEEEEIGRETHNKELRKLYDKDTELIIDGQDRPITPTCSFDISK